MRAALALPVLPLLHGCAAPLPVSLNAATTPAAQALLKESAEAHGLQAFKAIQDLNVSYAGEWRALIGKLQPALVDAAFRGTSEERLLLREGVVAQAHSGPGGRKQVLRRAGEYAFGRPAREVLYTVVPPEDKYKAKNFIDTFVYRGGDQIGAWSYAGLSAAGLAVSTISLLAAPISFIWLAVAFWLGRRNVRMERGS